MHGRRFQPPPRSLVINDLGALRAPSCHLALVEFTFALGEAARLAGPLFPRAPSPLLSTDSTERGPAEKTKKWTYCSTKALLLGSAGRAGPFKLPSPSGNSPSVSAA